MKVFEMMPTTIFQFGSVATTSNTFAVGLIAAGAVLLSAVISGAFSWWVAARGRRDSRSLAREDRRQARIEEAYMTIYIYVDKWEWYAQWRMQLLRLGGTEPETPTVSEAAAGIAALVASDEVEAAMIRFEKQLHNFNHALGAHRMALEAHQMDPVPGDDTVIGASLQIKETAQALIDQVQVVFKLMRHELALGSST